MYVDVCGLVEREGVVKPSLVIGVAVACSWDEVEILVLATSSICWGEICFVHSVSPTLRAAF